MRDVGLAFSQARYAILTALRMPRTTVFGVLFPVVLLVLFDAVFTKGAHESVAVSGGTLTASAYFTAGITAYAISLQTFTSLAVGLTAQRESGQLKRLRATPMPAWTFVAGQILGAAARGFAMAVALLAVGAAAFGVDLSAEHLVGFAAFVALGIVVFCALGIAVTAVTPTVDSASTIGPFVVVMLAFVSGVFVSVDQLPSFLASIGRFFPLYHAAHGLQAALLTGGGTGLEAGDVGALAAWGLAGTWVAARHFRWEPGSA